MLHLNLFDTLLANLWMNKLLLQPSRGGLEVKAWTDNSLHSASVGSNPAWVWYMDRSEVETLCRNSNCRAPAPGAAMPLQYI